LSFIDNWLNLDRSNLLSIELNKPFCQFGVTNGALGCELEFNAPLTSVQVGLPFGVF
jgi:hypothetical protein